jgi:hypothetical protein
VNSQRIDNGCSCTNIRICNLIGDGLNFALIRKKTQDNTHITGDRKLQ